MVILILRTIVMLKKVHQYANLLYIFLFFQIDIKMIHINTTSQQF